MKRHMIQFREVITYPHEAEIEHGATDVGYLHLDISEVRELQSLLAREYGQADAWRHVEDETPEDWQPVLALLESGKQKIGFKDGTLWKFYEGGRYIVHRVTYWQPLPDPPEDDSANP